MRIFKFLLLFLLTAILSCQDVDSLVNSIAERNVVECEAVGLVGSPSGVHEKFEMLKRKASKEELLELTNHENAVVVVYSSYALIDRELIEPNKLLQKFMSNQESVSTFCGCLGSSSSLQALIYYRYLMYRTEYQYEAEEEKRIINDSEELRTMDSLIIFSEDSEWLLRGMAFKNRIYSENYSSKIKEWAFEKNDFFALEYVFQNLKNGNEQLLIAGFEEYLNNKENHRAQKEEILQMKKEVENFN